VTSRHAVGQADKLVQRYLAQLDTALQGVDASRRHEILTEVQAHIDEGRTGFDPDDAASVRTLLDRVGDPLPSPPRRAHRPGAAAAGMCGRRG
jgi:hypothetical protein